MGEVYRATDSVLQRQVAVKLLSERYARDEEVHARFRREALSAARLSGTPHVITVFDVGEHRKQPYIVMEYLEGGSVYDRLREGRVSPAQTLAWLAQAGQALDRAHAQGVVHRDVKPANLLLDRDGSVNVSDFGIASTTGLDTLTLPGTILGTAGYLSPEQARGEPTTPASDRYALGVVAFELLTGRRPFEGDTAATEAFAHVTAPVPSAERIHPGLPDGVDAVLVRALAKDPADRPDSCAALVADLEDAFERASAPTQVAAAPAAVAPRAAQSTRPLPPAAGRPRRSGPRYRRLALVAVGLLVAGLLLAGLLGSLRERDASTARRPPGDDGRVEHVEPPDDRVQHADHHHDRAAAADERVQRPGRAERPRHSPSCRKGSTDVRVRSSTARSPPWTERARSPRRMRATTSRSRGSRSGAVTEFSRSSTARKPFRESEARSMRFASEWEDRCTEGDETATGQGQEQGPRRGRRTTEGRRYAELRDDLAVLGKPALRLLGEDHLPVREDVELGLLSGYRRRGDPRLRLDLGRETRGPFVVAASGRAVEDLDRHAGSLPAGKAVTTITAS